MSLLTSWGAHLAESWRRCTAPPRGWIGVDIGSRAVKLAQLERDNGHVRLVKRWLVPLEASPAPAASEELETAFLHSQAELAHLRKLFAGRECAAALSLAIAELRSFEVPAGTREEVREMVREELAAENERVSEEWSFDFWDAHSPTAELARVTAVAAPTRRVERIVDSLLAAGYECHVLDGVPCALARALDMVAEDKARPVAALDIGFRTATFVIAQDGRPLFARHLHGGHLAEIFAPLQQSLQLSHDQCTQLLLRYGLKGPGEASPAAASVQLLAHPLATLVEELERTLAYVRQHGSSALPAEMVLFGGGAAIRNLPAYVSQQIGLPVKPWRLAASGGEARDDALFGVAAALSAVAWENPPCT